jgi:hypothetical protein
MVNLCYYFWVLGFWGVNFTPTNLEDFQLIFYWLEEAGYFKGADSIAVLFY